MCLMRWGTKTWFSNSMRGFTSDLNRVSITSLFVLLIMPRMEFALLILAAMCLSKLRSWPIMTTISFLAVCSVVVPDPFLIDI